MNKEDLIGKKVIDISESVVDDDITIILEGNYILKMPKVDYCHGNRIFQVKETVFTSCQECKSVFNNPTLAYYVKDIDKVTCSDCAKKYKVKDMRIFINMNNIPNVKVAKEWDSK